jgi:hypothetical protein
MTGSKSTVAAVLAALLLAACSRGAPAREGITVKQARALAAGSPVTVEGIVSVRSGVIDAGFAITDDEAGIHVAADSTTRFAVGERVRVTGTRDDIHGLATIRPERVKRLGTAKLPPPRTVRTGEVGEATEGAIVTVTGRAMTSLVRDLPFGYKLWVDDGSGGLQLYVAASARGVGMERARVGSTVTATGFSGQYDATYEVVPRSRTAFTVAGAAP